MAKTRVRKLHRDPVVQPQDQSIRYIPLTLGKLAIVDIENFESLSRVNWHARKDYSTQSFYAREGRNSTPMHRIIAKASKGQLVDHINGNTLDNRRANLRIVTPRQNAINREIQHNNTSGVPGVTWHKRLGKWQVRIGTAETRVSVGYFDSKDEAILARHEAEKEQYGEYSRR